MLRPVKHTLTARDTRHLLYGLRDLNLAMRLAVGGERRVALGGCSSLDAPVERGVCYRLIEGGQTSTLRLRQAGTDLAIELEGPSPRHLEVGLMLDEQGRAASRELSARVALEGDARGLERFLRRVVRVLYAA